MSIGKGRDILRIKIMKQPSVEFGQLQGGGVSSPSHKGNHPAARHSLGKAKEVTLT